LSSSHTKSEYEKVEILNTCCYLGLNFYLNTCQFEKARAEAEQIEENWDLFKLSVDPSSLMTNCYNCIMLYWILGENSQASIWLNKIFEFNLMNKRQDLIVASRLMQMPVYYDLKKEYVGNCIESTTRTIKNNKEESVLSKTVLKYFKAAYKSLNPLAEIEQFYKALNDLKDSDAKYALGLEEMMLWCKCKLQNLPLKTIFENAQLK